MEFRKTPFYQKHLQNNGRIVDFSGWALPVEYKSILAEAKAVRNSCGLFDASHMGELAIKGRGAFSFLQKLISNDLSSVSAGQMQYNLFLSESGGIIDDLMIYHQGDAFLCVVNASNKDKVLKWLNKNIQPGVEIVDQSDRIALLSLQGPQAAGIVEKVFGQDVAVIEYLSFIKKQIGGQEILISRSGYTGEDGFEMYLPWENSRQWWEKLIKASQDFEPKPCGLGSRDILRIEAGYPLYGHEINDTINPYQASLGWAVKLNKDLIGKKKLLEVKSQGLKKKRVGFIMQERAIARKGYLLREEGRTIGEVSSGTYSPNIGKFIGMAYVDKDYAEVGREVKIKVRGKLYRAKIAKFPFINIKTKR